MPCRSLGPTATTNAARSSSLHPRSSHAVNDGPQGYRCNGLGKCPPGTSTAYPSGLTVGATFDAEAAEAWGRAMGTEFYNKGANIQLGPALCITRVPRGGSKPPPLPYTHTHARARARTACVFVLCCMPTNAEIANPGRSWYPSPPLAPPPPAGSTAGNFEYMSGEDPHLGYVMGGAATRGIQSQGVVANAKHCAYEDILVLSASRFPVRPLAFLFCPSIPPSVSPLRGRSRLTAAAILQTS